MTPMKKRIICLSLALAMIFGLCACGGSGKYKVVKSLGTQEYSIGFRNGDSTYHYIDKALRELSYEGVIDDLSTQWFGSSRTVDFPSKKDALDELGYIEERTFIIGVDLESAPLSFQKEALISTLQKRSAKSSAGCSRYSRYTQKMRMLN